MEQTLDGHFPGLGVVELGHAFNFAECNIVSVFQSMSALIQCSDDAFLVLVNTHKHSLKSLFAVGIDANKLVAKVTEDRAEEASGIGADEVGVLLTSDGINFKLLVCGCVGEDNDLNS